MRDFAPAGFFALRTPLLPFGELQGWSDELKAPGAFHESGALENALWEDRKKLRERLRVILSRPEMREALFIASPHLDEALESWLRQPDTEHAQGIERALVRYFVRMAGRATPFGLCAGCSVGRVDDRTQLQLEGQAQYQRHTRLGMDYLFALTEKLRRDPSLRTVFSYRPNSTLYVGADRLRYVAIRLKEKERSYHLVTLEKTDYLAATLNRAETGATFDTLSSALVNDEITSQEANDYVNELIDSQVLVADLTLPVTGLEPALPLANQLRQYRETIELAEKLEKTDRQLAAMDAEGLGISPSRYRALAQAMEELPGDSELSRFFQVDLIKPAPQATLGKVVVNELLRGVELLHRLANPVEHDGLKQFRDSFRSRYEMREMPLLEVLDEETGIGFGTGRETTPLLEGLHFSGPPEETVAWRKREKILLRKLSEALRNGAPEIILDRDDVEKLASTNPPPLPEAFAVTAAIAAPSEPAMAQGDFQLFLDYASGPSGAVLLGRFCHADPNLRKKVEKQLRTEEALQSNAVFAEIVHLPEGHFGNFICRPLLRAYEIPYLGNSGMAPSQQISVTDLNVSLQGERIILRSRRLGCEIIPRMTNAHNYHLSSLGVYKFLCTLQHQNVVPALSWDWGALNDAPFLPRVRTGRSILSRAQWRLDKGELKQFDHVGGIALFQQVQRCRAARSLPRWIAVADGDNTLPVDLDNVLSVETFVYLVRNRDEVILTEIFPPPDQLGVSGPEGRFVHELVVPFVRRSGEKKSGESALGSDGVKSPQPGVVTNLADLAITRALPPGSEWLFAKLYTGTATADHILCESVVPLVQQLTDNGTIDRWFFIRYGDPDWHLRLRFHGRPEVLQTKALPALHAATSPLLGDGRVWRMQFDTYEREMERYGGPTGIELTEKLFHLDSEAVLQILDLVDPGDEGLDERWRLALRGIDSLLDDFGFDLESKSGFCREVSENSVKERRFDENLRDELSEKFREERKSLEELLDRSGDERSPLSLGFDVFRERSRKQQPIVARLKERHKSGHLSIPWRDFAASCCHMFVNRLLRSAHQEQELVIYDFLSRLYRSQSARSRPEG